MTEENKKFKGILSGIGTIISGLGVGTLRALDTAPNEHVHKAFVTAIRKAMAALSTSGVVHRRQIRLVQILKDAASEILDAEEKN